MGNVSVIIPSIGRHDYLKRAISYYEKSGFDVIAATNTPIADTKAKMLESNASFLERIEVALQETDTEYCILSPDDDFISFSFLEKGCKILDEQSNVSSIVGNFVRYHPPEFTLNPVIYTMPEHLETEVISRIENGIRNYSNNYWVLYRKVVLQQILLYCKGVENYNLVEVLFKFIALASGKIASINQIYFYREDLVNSWGTKEQLLLDYMRNPVNQDKIQELNQRLRSILPVGAPDASTIIINNYNRFCNGRMKISYRISNKMYRIYCTLCKAFLQTPVEKKEAGLIKLLVTQ